MADPKDYTLVRLADNIEDNAILTYDAQGDTIVDSGLTAKHGELFAGANSVKVGLQTMSSAGEQVVWENGHTSIVYAPPWHIVDETNTEGSRDRVYGTLQTSVPFSDKSGVVENPTNYIDVPENGIVFSYTMEFEEAHTNVEFRLTYLDPRDPNNKDIKDLWREIKDVSAGENTLSLQIPNALYVGKYYFSIHPVDSTSTPVKLKGNPQNGEFAYSTKFRSFREVPLATKEYVTEEIAKIPTGGGGSGTGDMTKAVYDTNNNGIVDNAQKVNGIDSAPNSYYYGVDSDGNKGFHALPADTGGMPDASQGRTVVRSIVKYIQTAWDASSGQFPANSKKGNLYKAGSTGTIDGQLFEKDDYLLALQNSGDRTSYTGNWLRIVGKTYVHSIAGREGVIDSAVLKDILEDLGVKYMHEMTAYSVYVGTSIQHLVGSQDLKVMTKLEVNNPHYTYAISQDGNLARYVYIAMPVALANKVVGFRLKDGPTAHWDSYGTAINGPSDYTVFRSPHKLVNANIEIVSEI